VADTAAHNAELLPTSFKGWRNQTATQTRPRLAEQSWDQEDHETKER
jgi:hypothetical protein